MVVPVGSVPPGHLEQVDLALRRGITAAGGEFLNLPAGSLPRAADPETGECSEECEASMRSKPLGGALVLVRVSTAGDRFVLHVSLGIFRRDSASGQIAQLDEGATRLGRRIASTDSVLLLKGGAKGAQWFLDGRAFTLGADRTIKVSPGRHVVRIGAGFGEGALKMVDVVLGDRVVVTFAEGADGSPAGPPRTRASAIPRVAPRPAARAAMSDAWTARSGFVFISRERSISGENGTGYSAQFVGGGPEVAARIRPPLGVVRLDLAWLSYQLSSARFGGAGNTVTAHGGDSVRARGMVGYEHDFGGRGSLAGYGGAGWESHRADDPRGLGLLSSYRRISVDAEIAASVRLRLVPMKRLPSIGAHIGVTPWSSWTERPTGASGSNARSGPGVSWGVQSGLPIGDRWEGVVAYRGELRFVRFAGTANARVNPPIEGATVREFFNSAGVSLNRSF